MEENQLLVIEMSEANQEKGLLYGCTVMNNYMLTEYQIMVTCSCVFWQEKTTFMTDMLQKKINNWKIHFIFPSAGQHFMKFGRQIYQSLSESGINYVLSFTLLLHYYIWGSINVVISEVSHLETIILNWFKSLSFFRDRFLFKI